MSSTDPAVPDAAATAPGKRARTKHSPLLALLSILLGIVGTVLIGWSFLTGISAALDGASDGTSVYVALFFIGVGLVLVAIVFAIVGLVRRAQLTLSIIGLIVALLPALLVLVIAALAFL